ncbi:hypothetical protein PanWU01x14_222600 [Parasponia andersonii]|uniref:Uncharacterized protein n=1 Tax=Parasponia andersonii TaxID=3476 RepID=A0A2P5BP26_PARAD|nr:hypothetical protein PanWU01x14_222600 [Parasponia andersonii]
MVVSATVVVAEYSRLNRTFLELLIYTLEQKHHWKPGCKVLLMPYIYRETKDGNTFGWNDSKLTMSMVKNFKTELTMKKNGAAV